MGAATKRSAGDYARIALAGIRIANGALALFAPRFLARRVGVDPDEQPGIIYPFRMFGIRTILIGLQLLIEPERRRRSLEEAVLIHSSDTATAAITVVLGELPLRHALMATAISATNTLLSIVALRAED